MEQKKNGTFTITMNRSNIKMNKVIYVDVDGTLIYKGSLNSNLISFLELKKNDGFEIYLWSARGKEYAFNFAKEFEILELFEAILPKPSFLIDDMGRDMFKFSLFIKNTAELFYMK